LTRQPRFEELVGAETTGAERDRLRRAHELLLQAGPPAELPVGLRKAPQMGVVNLQERRRVIKRRTLILLAAAVAVAAVFAGGYGIGNRSGGNSGTPVAQTLDLRGTGLAPRARATLEVWHSKDGNVPMTLQVVGLHKLPPHSYYDVYLVRGGQVKPWGLCGTFGVGRPSRVLTLHFNAPYSHQKGDSWVVTRPGPAGSEPGRTVLRPVTA
jgi:hypothetical protein